MPKISLRLTLLIAVIVPLVSVMLIFSINLLWSVEQQVERQLQRELELVARSVRQPIAYSLEREREGGIQQALESAFETRRVYSAHVYDASGEQVASLGSLAPRSADDRRIRQVEDEEAVGGYERIEGREVYSYFLPLTDLGGRLNGLLQVTRDRGEIDRVIGEMRRETWQLIAIASALLVIVVLVGHQRFIGRPLKAMNEVMRSIESGDRDRRAEERGPSEIVALATRFNAMLRSLISAQQEVSDQRLRGEALEAELRRKEKLAAVGRLAAGVAHEMGSPLSVIDGNAQRVLRGRELDEPRRSAMAGIRAEVDRLSRIVRQLLTLGRNAPQQREVADLDALCRQAMTTIAHEAERRGTRIDYDPGTGEAPASAGLSNGEGAVRGGAPEGQGVAHALMVDAMRLQQALIQLLRNAVQAAPQGRVVLALADDAGERCISVDDSGEGIAEEAQELLFEPFFTTKSSGEGGGLGLAVAHSIIADHGGRIEVGDSPLGGARFVVRLPADDAVASQGPTA